MQRYEINGRTYIVQNEQLYKVEGNSNHPIDTEYECYDAVVFRGMVGEFECEGDRCIFLPFNGIGIERIDKEPLGESIIKLSKVERVKVTA